MDALERIDTWGAANAAAGVVRGDEELGVHGDRTRVFRWASIAKPCTTLATLVAAEEGIVDLDQPAGPPGSTLRHLLAHASGLPFHGDEPIAKPGERRIYSNPGIEAAAQLVEDAAGMPFAAYLHAAVFEPLGMGAELRGSAAAAVHGSLDDLLRLAREAQSPTLVAPETFADMTTVQFPGLAGVLPGFGRWDPNDWALGFELRDSKTRHWTGTRNSEKTYGHFGGSGTFLWVDPEAGLACACLTDREFDDWALDAWPAFSDAVLAEAA